VENLTTKLEEGPLDRASNYGESGFRLGGVISEMVQAILIKYGFPTCAKIDVFK